MKRRIVETFFLLAALGPASCRPAPDRAALARTVALHYEGNARAVGAGLLLKSGAVLTCAHVPFARAPRMPAFMAGNRSMVVAFSDPAFDLAVLAETGQAWQADAEDDWLAREDVRAGDEIVVSASPFGLPDSLLFGRISHTNRAGVDPAFPEIPFIQVQGVSFPGTSGAPVFHANGIVGIHRSSYGSASSGLGLVIPSGFVRAFLERAAQARNPQ